LAYFSTGFFNIFFEILIKNKKNQKKLQFE